jgi:hypothetical protein
MSMSPPKNPNSETETQPTGPGLPLGAILGIVVLAVVGVAMLGYAVFSLLTESTASAPVESATPQTQVVVIPTSTLAPPDPPTATPTIALPTDTAAPADTATAPPPSAPALSILQGANVRSGPGLNYAVIGGLAAGATAEVIGRDSSAQWFVIAFGGGQGWVSSLVAQYNGDVNALPEIAAPPPPPPTSTATPTNTSPPPPTATASFYVSRGIRGDYFRVRNPVAGVNQEVWFEFGVTNISQNPVSFSLLAAHTDTLPNAESWNNETFGPGYVLRHEDWIKFKTTGTYQLYLGICYAIRDDCLFNRAPWDRLSNNVTITIQ